MFFVLRGACAISTISEIGRICIRDRVVFVHSSVRACLRACVYACVFDGEANRSSVKLSIQSALHYAQQKWCRVTNMYLPNISSSLKVWGLVRTARLNEVMDETRKGAGRRCICFCIRVLLLCDVYRKHVVVTAVTARGWF